MNRQKLVILISALVLMAGTGGLLARFRTHQRLGEPGVKTSALAGTHNLQVDLPEHVLDYNSEALPVDDIVLNVLPPDTSFGQRRYHAPDGFESMVNVVLMGGDRTSLHKPQFCLEGAGWHIDHSATVQTTVRMERPCAYDLPIVKLIANKEAVANGRSVAAKGIYVYWYAADGMVSASTSGVERMWSMATGLLRTGTLQRWAYISYFSICAPGQEAATFERMKKLIVESVPQYQIAPQPSTRRMAARQ